MIDLRENVSLAEFTTLKLGGAAKYFTECKSVEEIKAALAFAKSRGLRSHILGGGSNTVFLEEGFDGLVLRIALRGIQFMREKNDVKMVVAGGEEWDHFVKLCIHYKLAGLECLSGIPGLVGATPIQNVGAYGQEVAETILDVKTIERSTFREAHFTNSECRFAYRKSRFNNDDKGRFIVTEVTFRLNLNGEPDIRYPELQQFIDSNTTDRTVKHEGQSLEAVRNAVLDLRRTKSMVIDAADPNSRSVGSFFKNPILTKEEFVSFEKNCRAEGIVGTIPTFTVGANVKVPAAWLIENAGFKKGFRKGGVGLSSNHTLALVNYGGTSKELLALAEDIRTTILTKFCIRIEREPVIVQ